MSVISMDSIVTMIAYVKYHDDSKAPDPRPIAFIPSRIFSSFSSTMSRSSLDAGYRNEKLNEQNKTNTR